MSSMLNVFVESSDQIKSSKTKKSHVFVHFLTENLIISNTKPRQTQLFIGNDVRSVLTISEMKMVSHHFTI